MFQMPNAEKTALPDAENNPSFVKRINSTHAYVCDMDDEMKDILHRIRKKATGENIQCIIAVRSLKYCMYLVYVGIESLSQEAALIQVERIRKQIVRMTIKRSASSSF